MSPLDMAIQDTPTIPIQKKMKRQKQQQSVHLRPSMSFGPLIFLGGAASGVLDPPTVEVGISAILVRACGLEGLGRATNKRTCRNSKNTDRVLDIFHICTQHDALRRVAKRVGFITLTAGQRL